MKNGARGSPILLKRPKDATILKVHTGYKPKTPSSSPDGNKSVRREKPIRMVRSAVTKQREKLVCPVCGILTFTLGNHIATHQGIQSKPFLACHFPIVMDIGIIAISIAKNLLTHTR